MSIETQPGISAQAVVDAFIESGVSHVIWLVDSESAFLYEALQQAQAAERFQVVPVCREGETIPLAMGVLIGGKRPVVVIQSTGFFESGDSLRGQAIDFGLPIVMLIGYRGYRPERSQMKDTAAIYLEPVLAGYGVPHSLLTPGNAKQQIAGAFQQAEARRGPVALLVPAEWE